MWLPARLCTVTSWNNRLVCSRAKLCSSSPVDLRATQMVSGVIVNTQLLCALTRVKAWATSSSTSSAFLAKVPRKRMIAALGVRWAGYALGRSLFMGKNVKYGSSFLFMTVNAKFKKTTGSDY